MENAPLLRFWRPLLLIAVAGVIFYLFPAADVVIVVGWVLVLGVSWYQVWRWLLRRRFTRKWGPEQKDLLLIYSNSPHWKEYIETRWLPKLGHRAVVLNWSERARWDELHPMEGTIARQWGGVKEFNPLALVIRAGAPVREVRFWQAFRDLKHGKDAELRRREQELGALLGIELS